MYAGIAHIPLQHLGIAYGVAQQGVGRGFGLPEFGNGRNGIGQVHLGHLSVGSFGQLVGDELAEVVRNAERQFLYACHVLQGQFGGHGAVGDDVGYVVGPIFLCHPVEYPAASVVVEVDIDIRQGDTVRIEETLEQQVILDRVNLGNTQAVGNGTTRSRTTAGPYADIQLLACGTDVVLHNQEVARETHCLHDVQFELDAFVGFVVQRVSIPLSGPFVGQFGQVVSLQLDAVELVESAELLDLFHPVFFAHDDLSVLVAGKLVEQVLLAEPLPVQLLCAERFGYGKVGHDGGMVDAVGLDLVADVAGSGQRFGQVGKHGVHFGPRLEPFLLGIEHTVGVIEVTAG